MAKGAKVHDQTAGFFTAVGIDEPVERPPPTVLAAAAAAFLIAILDVVDTVRAIMSPEGTGAVIGTLVRDLLLVVAGVLLLRRAAWALWTLSILFALSLFRALGADEWIEYAGVAVAAMGLVVSLLPDSRAWVKPRAAPAIPERA